MISLYPIPPRRFIEIYKLVPRKWEPPLLITVNPEYTIIDSDKDRVHMYSDVFTDRIKPLKEYKWLDVYSFWVLDSLCRYSDVNGVVLNPLDAAKSAGLAMTKTCAVLWVLFQLGVIE